jgi:hypothetical protein
MGPKKLYLHNVIKVYYWWNPQVGAQGEISHRYTSSRDYFDGGKCTQEQWGCMMVGELPQLHHLIVGTQGTRD